MNNLKSYFVKLNIFEIPNDLNEENAEYRYIQRTNLIATRLFFFVLFLSLVILLIFTSLNTQTIKITLQNPTQNQIASLPNDRICPCSCISIPYGEFLSGNPSFHQVCSSDFISDRWIESLFHGNEATYFFASDIRSTGFAQFQTLASFCKISKERANRMLSFFASTQLISSKLVDNRMVLHKQVSSANAIIQSSSTKTFRAQIELISLLIISNQMLNGLMTNLVPNTNIGKWALHGSKIHLKSRNYKNLILDCYCTSINLLNINHCSGISGIYSNQYDIDAIDVVSYYNATIPIPDWRTSCMPVDAILLSSLECFYNQSCLNNLRPYLRIIDHIPRNFTALNNQLPSRYNISTKLFSIIEDFMVEDWFIEESYERYFNQCLPTLCTYTTNIRSNFLEILEIMIGLFGGLCSVLILIIPLIVKFIRKKFWPMPRHDNTSPLPRISLIKRLKEVYIPKLKKLLIELNLFKITINDNNNTERHLRYQRIITRIYILILLLSFIILTINFVVTPEMHIETVNNPNLSDFFALQSNRTSSLQCFCSNISIPYNSFLIIEPDYHQICSSNITSPFWLDLHRLASLMSKDFLVNAFHINAGSLFFLLSTLCDHSRETIDISYHVFRNYTLVTAQLIDEKQFQSEIDEIINNWQTSTINNFRHTIQLIRTIYHGNHLAGAYANAYLDLSEKWFQFPSQLLLNSSFYYDQCNCILSAHCRSPMAVYDITSTVAIHLFTVPGLYMGCSRLDALFSSTMECFYNQTCIDQVLEYTVRWMLDDLPKFIPLNSSLNFPNETMESIVNRMFVEEWIRNVSYENYYVTCAPATCRYEDERKRSVIDILTQVISIFGGLTSGLKIIFVIFLHLLTKITDGDRLSVQTIRIWFFAAQNNQQRLKTRITVILLLITFITLSLIRILSHISITNEVSKPSYDDYENLRMKYSTTVQCPCSQMSIQYKSFFNLSVLNRHQICSSDFITDRWIQRFLLPNLQSTYSPREFRTSAIGFFQLLSSFCQFTQEYLTDELDTLANKSLIHSQIVSSNELHRQIQSIIQQFQLETSHAFLNMLELIRMMINNNTLISLFQTNWKWTDLIFVNHNHWGKIVHTKPVVYNQTCNCGLSSECIEELVDLPGLYVGCYPLEALLQSNLQCFYNSSCIQSMTNQLFQPLDSFLPTQYQINSSIQSILNELMVEEWIDNISYQNYYNICSPSYCLYSHRTHRPFLDIFSSLLSLYGGLVIITTTLATILAHLWQKRRNQVQPIATIS